MRRLIDEIRARLDEIERLAAGAEAAEPMEPPPPPPPPASAGTVDPSPTAAPDLPLDAPADASVDEIEKLLES